MWFTNENKSSNNIRCYGPMLLRWWITRVFAVDELL
jgi:hypothetical protein